MSLEKALTYDYDSDPEEISGPENVVYHSAKLVQDTPQAYEVVATISDGRNCTFTWMAVAERTEL